VNKGDQGLVRFSQKSILYQKIQYLPDSLALYRTFTHTSAPTRRRRKAGVGCTSPLSGACRLPRVALQFFRDLTKIPSYCIRRRLCVVRLIIFRLFWLLARADYEAFDRVEDECQGRATSAAKPKMGNSAGKFQCLPAMGFRS
jgi:hypothetical protein